MSKTLFYFFVSAAILIGTNSTLAQTRVMIESGAFWQHRNDVRISPTQGSHIEFDQFNQGPFFHYRAELSHEWGARHGWRFVIAPLSLNVKGTFSQNINFNKQMFNANEEVNINYQFNSYRWGYFYSIIKANDQTLNIGFTLKLRDAQIGFEQKNVNRVYDNLGFVPLLYIDYQYQIHSDWYLHANADFAGASQGRAIDLALKLRKDLSKNWSAAAGGRTLEGGAENDKVFTFSWINYAVVDLTYNF